MLRHRKLHKNIICIYVISYIILYKYINVTYMSLIITKDKSSEVHIGESIVKSTSCKNILGIDSKLHF